MKTGYENGAKTFNSNDSVEEVYNKIITEETNKKRLQFYRLTTTLSFNKRKGTGNKLKKLNIKIKQYNRELYDQALKEGFITEVETWKETLISKLKNIILFILFIFLLDVGCQAISQEIKKRKTK